MTAPLQVYIDTGGFNTITFPGEILEESPRQEMRLPETQRPCMIGGGILSTDNDKTLSVCAHANRTDASIDSHSDVINVAQALIDCWEMYARCQG